MKPRRRIDRRRPEPREAQARQLGLSPAPAAERGLGLGQKKASELNRDLRIGLDALRSGWEPERDPRSLHGSRPMKTAVQVRHPTADSQPRAELVWGRPLAVEAGSARSRGPLWTRRDRRVPPSLPATPAALRLAHAHGRRPPRGHPSRSPSAGPVASRAPHPGTRSTRTGAFRVPRPHEARSLGSGRRLLCARRPDPRGETPVSQDPPLASAPTPGPERLAGLREGSLTRVAAAGPAMSGVVHVEALEPPMPPRPVGGVAACLRGMTAAPVRPHPVAEPPPGSSPPGAAR